VVCCGCHEEDGEGEQNGEGAEVAEGEQGEQGEEGGMAVGLPDEENVGGEEGEE
jgi:hypothetical protein